MGGGYSVSNEQILNEFHEATRFGKVEDLEAMLLKYPKIDLINLPEGKVHCGFSNVSSFLTNCYTLLLTLLIIRKEKPLLCGRLIVDR